MRKFRCISLKENENVVGGWSQSFTVGKEYEPSEEEGFWLDKLPTLIGDDGTAWICDPACFEEIFEQEQKSPEQYYAGQNNILSVSGTFGDVVFSLSGNFEKCLTVLDFISSLEVEKK